ncbi:MAG: NADH-quinone oxidoreductase subunit NuoE [Oscillospiraceae bacterium]|nr:NADH-quinone oxidoreductase subunit NuoE [Oscillospiraceae bacterium]
MSCECRENLIEILQKTQEESGWLSRETLEKIAGETGIKPAKVIGVATFYAQFRDKPVGKNLILLCQGTACHVNGSAEIEAAIREHLKVEEGEITEGGKFTYSNVACLGCCSLAPAMMIISKEKGDKTYGKLTRESVVKILDEY